MHERMDEKYSGKRPIHFAAEYGNITAVRTIIEQYHVDPTQPSCFDYQGNTVLHFAAYSGNLELVKFLLTNQPQMQQLICMKNSNGMTPYDFTEGASVRQYLLPLQLQEETKQCLANGGAGLTPGIDMGGMQVAQQIAPPPTMSSPPPTGGFHAKPAGGLSGIHSRYVTYDMNGNGYQSPAPVAPVASPIHHNAPITSPAYTSASVAPIAYNSSPAVSVAHNNGPAAPAANYNAPDAPVLNDNALAAQALRNNAPAATVISSTQTYTPAAVTPQAQQPSTFHPMNSTMTAPTSTISGEQVLQSQVADAGAIPPSSPAMSTTSPNLSSHSQGAPIIMSSSVQPVSNQLPPSSLGRSGEESNNGFPSVGADFVDSRGNQEISDDHNKNPSYSDSLEPPKEVADNQAQQTIALPQPSNDKASYSSTISTSNAPTNGQSPSKVETQVESNPFTAAPLPPPPFYGTATGYQSTAAPRSNNSRTRERLKPDGFHSSSSDKNLQKLYGHVKQPLKNNIPPPPTSGNSQTRNMSYSSQFQRPPVDTNLSRPPPPAFTVFQQPPPVTVYNNVGMQPITNKSYTVEKEGPYQDEHVDTTTADFSSGSSSVM